ncbi:uncharacterized protein LOC107271859 isoform X2 [Cephus cinctus]|uniref:Uncharacterized protein LOC107271859 isoform X2 n=1 Tax=Cephus cinctus TaxID=211228 RepID=A0AAJ7FQX1_CEPCN|nr:uncharacterized protein LOC107271859 isoform X2 [Cephus cinctus]
MSESEGEQAARSVALEQAYVHEVYEQCAEKTAQGRHWPRIYQFLEELEPGALVCDIGCGNGKYLSVNQSIFKVGVDRCKRLTDIAREKKNEVLICDNLALPFRDESFDAVLSIAVVHHFATTERRVHALKELARVLRIGGRLVISVWAMEQRHRKFESQDVLVPWPKAYCLNSSVNGTRTSGVPYSEETLHCDQPSKKDFLISKRTSQRKCRSRSYWIDPIFSPSPSTSSLSSPNETCYSFFRRALQKLAGGKRAPGSRPWFLESWHNGRDRPHLEHEDSGDVDDIPIELRRLEDIGMANNKLPDTLSVKSKSLGDILEIQRLDLVRSRSSIPGLCSTLTSDLFLDEHSENNSSQAKPRLVKQKSHFIEDTCLEIPNTAIQELLKDLPDFQIGPRFPVRRGNVHKQSSMNEELMSADRLREKERVRQNITKQASLNEELIYKRKAFEAFKDSIYSGTATKRFQLLKSDLTNRIKQTTTDKVSGLSIRNGFVKMLQGWKSTESEFPPQPVNVVNIPKKESDPIERRLSREDGSDSSKDSSLQSDTSVDSEDSFASVIYVPKPEQVESSTRQLATTSAPPSPRIKHPPDLTSSRLKMIPMSPLLKQFSAGSKSLPPPSPPGLSPRTLGPTPRAFFGGFSNGPFKSLISTEKNSADLKKEESKKNSEVEIKKEEVKPPAPVKVDKPLQDEDENRKVRLNQIKELLKQKPGFATRCTKTAFPLVRRASTATTGRLETVTRPLPRLLSLELFNPETDDLDSDSSGVSSPESVGSVISVISDERFTVKVKVENSTVESVTESKEKTSVEKIETEEDRAYDLLSNTSPTNISTETSSQSIRLLEAAAHVANSIEDAVETAIKLNMQVEPTTQRSKERRDSLKTSCDDLQELLDTKDVGKSWNEECRQHLIDFTEKLSENLINDIDRYCQSSKLDLADTKNPDVDAQGVALRTKVKASKTRKYSELADTIAWLKSSGIEDKEAKDLLRQSQENILDFVLVSDSGEFVQEQSRKDRPLLGFCNSVESSDVGDSAENTTSISEESGSILMTKLGSTGSLQQPSQPPEENPRCTENFNECSMSASSSQESLPSDQNGGGAITYHQYYHVFREGELDQLIEKYVENLHVISSYYDHASWCIVAEKVQVWTI